MNIHNVECGFVDQIELLTQFGPTIQVQIGFDPSWHPTNNSVPTLPSNTYPALIDTGATESCIDSQIAANLELPVFDERHVAGVHGSDKVNVHVAQIHIPELPHTIYGAFCGVHLHAGGQPHCALLGRTFLRRMKMVYDGSIGSVILSRPTKDS